MRIGVVGSMQHTEKMLEIRDKLVELGHDAYITSLHKAFIGKTDTEKEEIKLHQKNGSLMIFIKDDVCFKGHQKTFNGGYGFGNMEKRTKELGGNISVNTEDGTEIKVNIPI